METTNQVILFDHSNVSVVSTVTLTIPRQALGPKIILLTGLSGVGKLPYRIRTDYSAKTKGISYVIPGTATSTT